MAVWVLENLGERRELQLDRINNDVGYEPGNMRLSTSRQNTSHTRKTALAPLLHKFREMHPSVRYADATLPRMLKTMTFEQIVERYHRKSSKPKGVYGTFSTPDPFIASLSKGS